MASTQRTSIATLSETLRTRGEHFSFFRAVQALQRLSPGACPVGELGPPASEAIRFAHDERFVFSTSDVLRIAPHGTPGAGDFSRITTTFFGLTGAVSPLSTPMGEEVLEAVAADDTSLRDFYDIFHHRLISLFFRAWKKHRLAAGARADGSDIFSRRMQTFVGIDCLGSTAPAPAASVTPPGLAAIFAQRTRPARSLEVVLGRALPGTRIRVESFVARHVSLATKQRMALGRQNITLGRDTTLGRSVLDRSTRFRIAISPVDEPLLHALLPGGADHERIRTLVRSFTGGFLEPELDLHLTPSASPRFCLGNRRGATLGVTSRLTTTAPKVAARIVLSENRAATSVRIVETRERDCPTSVEA